LIGAMRPFSSALVSCRRVSSTPSRAFAQRLGTGLVVGQGGFEAVHDRQQVVCEALQSVFLRRGDVGLGPLAGVFRIGQSAHHAFALLLYRSEGFGKLQLDGLLGRSGILGLNGFFLHPVELGAGHASFKLPVRNAGR
jgi:hypothetical protein